MPPKKNKAAAAPEPPAKKAKAEAKKEAPKKEAPKKEEPKKEAPKEEPKKEEPKTEEPKKDEPAEQKDVEMKEDTSEKEKDAPKETRPTIKDAVTFDPSETTLNFVSTTGGKVIRALSDGGMQFLIAGARGSVGVKAGRYLFECKVVEALMHVEGGVSGKSRVPLPRQLVRIGVSPAGSQLVLDSEEAAGFDSEGYYLADGKRNSVSRRIGRDQVIGLLINLDPKSPNADTLSLFLNGERVSQPQPLPDKLKGKPLFPHLSFRNVTLQVNFGPRSLTTMPFTCRMLGEAATADVKVVKPTPPKDGKYDVVLPVAFPDEGTFAWLDKFLEANPQYVELSDRKVQEWAVKSGIWKPGRQDWRSSNDKPTFNFGVHYVDDFSIQRVLKSIASVVPRNYVVMEVKQNLCAADRATTLKRFALPHYRKIAHVVMGEPDAEWKATVQKAILEEKQQKVEMQWKARQADRDRRKAVAQRQKELAEEKAKREAEAKEKKEGEEKDDEKKEEKKDEEKKEGEEKDEKDAEMKEEEQEEECPVAELTEDEKKLNFKPSATADLSPQVLNATFAQFSIPEDSEGFDVIRYEWQKKEPSKEYLRKWVLHRKLTSRIDDLKPGKWFEDNAAEFEKSVKEWQEKQKTYKDEKAKEEAKEPKKEGAEEDAEEDKKAKPDVFAVENINDLGTGEPLFSNFEFEDWAMLTLRWELHTLQAAFAKDANDPDRKGVHEDNLQFYYGRYFKKQFIPKAYGKETFGEVIDIVKDAVELDSTDRILTSVLKEDVELPGHFVRMQEECRRRRQQRIDAGDETARLDFSLLQRGPVAAVADPAEGAWAAGAGPRMVPAPRPSGWQPRTGGKGKGNGKWTPQYAPRVGKGIKKD